MPPEDNFRKTNSNATCSGGFLGMLATVPIVKASLEKYESTKKGNGVLGMGLGVAEICASLALKPTQYAVAKLSSAYPDKAISIEKAACSYLGELEEKCPMFQENPEVMVEELRIKTSQAIRSGVIRALKTYPGQLFLKGVNSAISASEAALQTLLPEDERCESRESAHATLQEVLEQSALKQARLAESVAEYRSYDVADKCVMTSETGKVATLLNVVKVPIKILLKLQIVILKKMGKVLAVLAGCHKRRKSLVTHNKKAEIDRRRKVSPKKRLKQSSVHKVINAALSSFGLTFTGKINTTDIKLYVDPENKELSPKGAAKPEKRKYDDLSEESYSDESGLDLMELDCYLSSEDSDYEIPDEHESTDSLEYEEGDTESDLESEEVGFLGKKKLLHLKMGKHPGAGGDNKSPSSGQKKNCSPKKAPTESTKKEGTPVTSQMSKRATPQKTQTNAEKNQKPLVQQVTVHQTEGKKDPEKVRSPKPAQSQSANVKQNEGKKEPEKPATKGPIEKPTTAV